MIGLLTRRPVPKHSLCHLNLPRCTIAAMWKNSHKIGSFSHPNQSLSCKHPKHLDVLPSYCHRSYLQTTQWESIGRDNPWIVNKAFKPMTIASILQTMQSRYVPLTIIRGHWFWPKEHGNLNEILYNDFLNSLKWTKSVNPTSHSICVARRDGQQHSIHMKETHYLQC